MFCYVKASICITTLLITIILLLPQGTIMAGPRNDSIPVLLYHRVGYTADLLTVSPGRFAQDLDELSESGYETISLETFRDYLMGKNVELPPNPILITFDDSYQDNYDYAYPILKEYGFIAAFFVITGYVDQYPDRLTSTEIKEMYHNGMSFGSHTVSHKALAKLSQDGMWNEMFFSKQFLEKTLEVPITAIAYPEGAYNEEVARIAAGLGYEIGFTVKPGFCRRQAILLMVPRIPIFRYTGDVLDEIGKVQYR